MCTCRCALGCGLGLICHWYWQLNFRYIKLWIESNKQYVSISTYMNSKQKNNSSVAFKFGRLFFSFTTKYFFIVVILVYNNKHYGIFLFLFFCTDLLMKKLMKFIVVIVHQIRENVLKCLSEIKTLLQNIVHNIYSIHGTLKIK